MAEPSNNTSSCPRCSRVGTSHRGTRSPRGPTREAVGAGHPHGQASGGAFFQRRAQPNPKPPGRKPGRTMARPPSALPRRREGSTRCMRPCCPRDAPRARRGTRNPHRRPVIKSRFRAGRLSTFNVPVGQCARAGDGAGRHSLQTSAPWGRRLRNSGRTCNRLSCNSTRTPACRTARSSG